MSFIILAFLLGFLLGWLLAPICWWGSWGRLDPLRYPNRHWRNPRSILRFPWCWLPRGARSWLVRTLADDYLAQYEI